MKNEDSANKGIKEGGPSTTMRLPVALLLVAGLLAVPAQAQDPGAPLLTDLTGDVRTEVQGQPGPATTLYPAADLVSLALTEEASAFVIQLGVDDLRPASEDTGVEGTRYDIDFTHNGRDFQLAIFRTLPSLSDFTFATLAMRDLPQDEWSVIWSDDTALVVDFVADLFTVTLPRDVLADADGAAPFPGRSLDGIQVHAASGLSEGTISIGAAQTDFPYDLLDDMPNAGKEPATYAIQLGTVQTGNARLSSDTPFRASNGEATTYVFEVVAENLGEDEDVFDLVAVDVPDHLTVVLPVPLVSLEGEDAVTVPVLVTVPFGHDHGSASSFILELRSSTDPGSVGRLQMGVRFLAVPQPAGHHDTLWLHPPAGAQSPTSVLQFTPARMNTLEDDPAAGDQPYMATGLSFNVGEYYYDWDYWLAPALEMGLDVDVFREGSFSIPIATTAPLMQSRIEGALWVVGNEDEGSILIATFESETMDMAQQATTIFTGTLRPAQDGDEVPFQPGQNLYLSVQMTTAGPVPTSGFANEAPAIAKGAFLQVPLNEWHDPVNEALAALDGPALRALGPQERLVNPGEAVQFAARITNPLNDSRTIRLGISGPHAAWAELPDSIHVGAGESANVTVTVRVPEDAVHGDRADLVLQAYTKQDPNARGLLRLVAQVDTAEDQVDDLASEKVQPKKESPGAPLGLLVAVVAALVALRRRTPPA